MVLNELEKGSEEGAEFCWRDQHSNLWIRMSTEFFYSHNGHVVFLRRENTSITND